MNRDDAGREESSETVAGARRRIAERLRAAGLDNAALDARLLLAAALGMESAELFRAPERRLTGPERARLEGLTLRRLKREPVARILGHKEFWGRNFALGLDSLIPRPETETLVSAALDLLDRTGPRSRPLRLADLGTGSGVLAVTLLLELPEAAALGTDLSPGALRDARANAGDHGVAHRFLPVCGSFAAPLAPERFDLIVSNPPYIARDAIAALDPEVRDHDPRLALDGGPDGLDAYRALLPGVASALRAGGTALLEIGAGQAGAVARLAAKVGLSRISAVPDLAGIDRAIVAGRS